MKRKITKKRPTSSRNETSGFSRGLQKRPLKIVHLGKFYWPATGGMETYVKTLVENERRLGFDSQVICINHQGSTTVQETIDGVPVTRLGHLYSISKLDICPDLHQTLTNLDADVVHVHVPNPLMILGLLRVDWEWPVIVTYQSDHINFPVLGRLFSPIESQFYKRVHTIIATSQPYSEYSPLLRKFKDKVSVVPMGIDLNPFLKPTPSIQKEARQLKKSYPGPVWLACGRLIPYKGFEFAIEAMKYTTGSLILIGDGPLRSSLEAFAHELGLKDRVQFLGRRDNADLIAHYLIADALLFPSIFRSEAFGLVQVEAMAAKCPVINTEIEGSGVSWVAQNNESALTVKPKSAKELAEATYRIMNDALLRKRLVTNARKRAVSVFDQSKMANKIANIYRIACGITEPTTIKTPVRRQVR